MSPAQSTVGIARGLGAATTQRRLPVASVKCDHAKADAALARVTLACLVFLNRLRSGNSGWAVPRSLSSLGCALLLGSGACGGTAPARRRAAQDGLNIPVLSDLPSQNGIVRPRNAL